MILLKTALPELHKALYAGLTSYQPLMDVATDVLDDVEEGQVFPYITVGDPVANPWDTKNTIGENLVFTLHIWSQTNSKGQTYQIMNLIHAALSRPQTIGGGFVVVKFEREGQRVFTDIDQTTRHGVMEFRAYVNQ